MAATGLTGTSGADGNAAPAPLRVLYVEDDRVTGLLFAEALRQVPQLSVRVAETPSEALSLARAWTPQVLVLDAQLPEMSGHALLPLLRALPGLGQVPAFMCSADGDAHALAQAQAAGFQGFWCKPVPAAELRLRLLALADNARP